MTTKQKQAKQPPGVVVRERALTDYKFDPDNANQGSMRGQQMIEESLTDLGAGRSVLVDSGDTLIAGNHTVQGALAIGMKRAIEIEAPPDTLVVVKRPDLKLATDLKARRLANADNRISQVNINFDPEQLLDTPDALDGFWRDDEIAALQESMDIAEQVTDALDEANQPEGDRLHSDRKKQIKPVLYVADLETFENAIAATGEVNRGAALLMICKAYLEGKKQA